MFRLRYVIAVLVSLGAAFIGASLYSFQLHRSANLEY